MTIICKPTEDDLEKIRNILDQWTDEEEVEKYIRRIKNEIEGMVEFNTRFWIAKDEGEVLGIVGVSDPLPKVVPLARTNQPGEIKILYLDNAFRGKGIGRMLVKHVELVAKESEYKELLIRSAERYRDTAYDFYRKMGYAEVGIITDSDETKRMQVFEKLL